MRLACRLPYLRKQLNSAVRHHKPPSGISPVDPLPLVAPAVSAVVALIAVVVSIRSLGTARAALAASTSASRRSLLREISLTAAAVCNEADRIQRVEQELRLAYSTAMVFSGSSKNSGIEEMAARGQRYAAEALPLRQNAEVLVNAEAVLRDAPNEELDRVQVRLATDVRRLQSTRDELERDPLKSPGEMKPRPIVGALERSDA